MLDRPASPDTAGAPAGPPRRAEPRRGFWAQLAERLGALLSGRRAEAPPERSVAFTIAVIALGAKLAKVDGDVRRAEVAAFRRIFVIPRAEEKNAARVFDLARQTPAGFDAWAGRIAALFPPGDPVLEDVIEGLAVIAAADGSLHEAEHAFIREVGRIFGLPGERVGAILMRHDQGHCEPCAVLGLPADAPLDLARARYRALVFEAHPDRALARGLPPEAVRLAEARTRRLNEAWARFRALREGAAPPVAG